MTRTSWLSAVSCTALLAGIAAAGCGDTTSVITHDAGSGTGGTVTGGGTGGRTTTGSGGRVGGGTGGALGRGTGGAQGGGMGGMVVRPGTGGRVATDAGPPPNDGGQVVCRMGGMCTTTGEACTANCRAGGRNGTQDCMCAANAAGAMAFMCGACMVPDAGQPPPVDAAPPPPTDAGTMCAANATCAAGFTCDEMCRTAAGAMGTRACMCGANGRLACPGACNAGDAGAPPPPADAGLMCVNGAMCTTGDTCEATCRVGGMNGTRACMCGANNRLTCATACTVAGADAAAD